MHRASDLFVRFLAGSVAALCLVMTGCASTADVNAKLPFHIAIVPPDARPYPAALQAEGNETELAFVVDEPGLLVELERALAQAFTKVSRLSAPADPASDDAGVALLTQAQQQGADLILRASLSYDPKVRTALNDRFWLNLPLFALGGPFCWFVSDRSYYCFTRLEGQLFDVSVAAGSETPSLGTGARVLRVEREAKEASLSFLQRADGAGAYALSLICPAGWLASETAAVPAELDAAVVSQLCRAMTNALQDRAIEIAESDLVDFHPRGVRVARDGAQAALVGEMVLGLRQANELGTLRYRLGSGNFVDASWGTPTMVSAGGDDRGRKVYPFTIPLDAAATGTVQIEVEQLDRFATRRTFTFPLDGAAAR